MAFSCCFKAMILKLITQGLYFALTLILGLSIKLLFTEKIEPNLKNEESELTYFTNSDKKKKMKFTSMLDEKNKSKPSDDKNIFVSIVIPAYNEEDRIKVCLDEILDYFDKNPSKNYEIIICNDGSKDNTSKIVLEDYVDKYGTNKNGFRLLELAKNRGKGGAVRKGVLASRGRYILFCDADGATKFEDLDKLLKKMESLEESGSKKCVVVGSRAHLEKESMAERSFLRTILMHGFHFFVKYIGNVRSIKDTQCGFKLFTRDSAQFLFSNLHIERWAFDVELLFLCEKYGISTGEIPVRWQEIDGSKLTPLTAALQMARDLIVLRLYYIFGVYQVKGEKNKL